MPPTEHQKLAEKFMLRKIWKKETFLPDSLIKLVAFAYTEEEAQVVNALRFFPLPARAIAKKLKRPVPEIKTVLDSLADRCLIFRTERKFFPVYAFMPLGPGVFEAQMLRSRGDTKDEYYREFSKLFEDVYKEIFTWLKPKIGDRNLQLGRIIPIERSIDSTPGLGVIALSTDRYSEIVERNTRFCLMNVCACRHEKDLLGEWCGKPKDVCSAMGRIADWAIENGFAREVSKEEFLDAKMRAAEAGLVNMTDNLRDPMQICSCCGCCCGALRILNEFNIPSIITQSHFEAVISQENCKGCGTCVEFCPMKAISINGGKAVIDYSRCIGCGICVIKCNKNKAVSLKERENYKPPAKTLFDFALNRYFEYKGYENKFLPKISIGIGRILEKTSPFHVSGPGYKPRR